MKHSQLVLSLLIALGSLLHGCDSRKRAPELVDPLVGVYVGNTTFQYSLRENGLMQKVLDTTYADTIVVTKKAANIVVCDFHYPEREVVIGTNFKGQWNERIVNYVTVFTIAFDSRQKTVQTRDSSANRGMAIAIADFKGEKQ